MQGQKRSENEEMTKRLDGGLSKLIQVTSLQNPLPPPFLPEERRLGSRYNESRLVIWVDPTT